MAYEYRNSFSGMVYQFDSAIEPCQTMSEDKPKPEEEQSEVGRTLGTETLAQILERVYKVAQEQRNKKEAPEK